MFSDLVGSTALSARMDPEDLREVISAYQKCVAETVQRFGGFVAKYMGDGVLVYFGYPQAHEDDAERAVRAGLELIAAVGGLKSSAPLQTRVGIATGLVVVGDLIGSGAAQEQAVVGETPNLAARLQGIAEPNTVVIAESTRKLLGNLFELAGPRRTRTSRASPGRCEPGRRCDRASVESRFEALHASGLTELVGREEELELLLRRWSKAKTGEGQVVLLSGEAGIGKSRLTAALLERLAGEPHTRLRYFCSPQHTDSALYPIIGQMERAAGFAHDDTAQAKLDKLDAVLAQTSTSNAGRGTVCRDAVAAERRTLSGARTDPRAAPAENAGSAHCADGGVVAAKSGADDLRGCALDRPHEPGSVRSDRGPDSNPSRAADRDVPARVRAAVDRTAVRDGAHPQSAGERDIATMIDRACGERRMQPTSIPGIAKSAPYCASPVTFGTPSGRTGLVPTHLNCFTASREVMSSTATSPDCRVALACARALRGRRANASVSAISLIMPSRPPRDRASGLDRQRMLD